MSDNSDENEQALIVEQDDHFVISRPVSVKSKTRTSRISTITTIPSIEEGDAVEMMEVSQGKLSSRGSGEGKSSRTSISHVSSAGDNDTNTLTIHAATDDVGGGDDDETQLKLHEMSMIHHEMETRKKTVSKAPLKITLPDKMMALGLATGGGKKDRRDENPLDVDEVMVFSAPGNDQWSRSRLFKCFLLFLMPLDVVVFTTIYAQASLRDKIDDGETVIFVCTLLALIMCYMGMKVIDSRMLTLFVVIYYVDALINLFRIENKLQFAHFSVQLLICHCVTQYKISLMGQWFMPR